MHHSGEVRSANMDEGCAREEGRSVPRALKSEEGLQRGRVSICRELKGFGLGMFHLSPNHASRLLSPCKSSGMFKPRVV